MFDSIYFDAPMSIYFKLFLFYFNAVFTYIFFILFRSYTSQQQGKSNTELSHQIKFFGIWIGFWAVWWYAVYLPILWIEIYPYTSILMTFYPIIMGYAILKHHLFDARSAILSILRIIFIAFLAGIVGWITYAVSWYFLGYRPVLHPIEIMIGILIIATVYVAHRSQKIYGYFLLPSLAELENQWEKFLAKNGVYTSRSELIDGLKEVFWESLKVTKVDILHTDDISSYPYCIEYFARYQKVLVLSELIHDDVEGESHGLIEEVRTLGELIIPIEHVKKGERFFLILGQKESENTFTQGELRIINRFLPKIALSLQILDYNHALQEEVRTQTKALNAKNRELKKAYKKLQDLDKNKDNFLAIASHELRTPMTIIKGYSDLFLNNTFGSLTPDARSYMQKIYDSTESLIELVNNILDISKIEAGKFEILLAEANIRELIRRVFENFETIYREKWIELTLSDTSGIEMLTTDASKFSLICTNLLSNAYKFTETGWKVEIKVYTKDEKYTISVTDTGRWIEPEKIEHIFEKFNQMDNTNYTKKSIHGTGLWLHLCKQIIELLGWTISVESTLSIGSTFLFSIPLSHDNQVTP